MIQSLIQFRNFLKKILNKLIITIIIDLFGQNGHRKLII